MNHYCHREILKRHTDVIFLPRCSIIYGDLVISAVQRSTSLLIFMFQSFNIVLNLLSGIRKKTVYSNSLAVNCSL